MLDDVFCKIVSGEIKADIVYKDNDFWVIKDINPQAPVHLLIIPAKHFTSLEDFMEGENDGLLGRAFVVAHKVAHKAGIAEKGYRLILNEGEDGGKLVPHLHIHLLGGKKLGPKIVK
ncbi:MAG: histidine triad nucleotide-binding protein [Candidatus Yanofskybacteria bacterium RIFCSPHIGHO2_02_FULL_41_29]|uniref:Histidine triad nucleotide-binding protein n=1 Tax=Candidatus Yanofskybacteria bacterium RIFCSPHIGHO2_01_FULL_41_53 TaxID=1802663 RepID=A0A1F8EM48_9BACT|nr:MAG: histidine triad nucleotide-binding protein [Candidatus Yanofskybacteria bacterium RIFCSPHIGHO2_01_FULL_41_53]OGN12028.1 MAG: histidine triad nucleotide-binding protein [Candidatus Yanofskybacteria bacterium RIFCSPHIGHO2_02_FULL_41_29]OGN21274.1 MAG: histidine triad nucleotide-binding protein [Candidatus Yanofskybacteria bacterium RIFCSPLOWO2_01_FULL_41_67]OGN28656.1 MAG: histidine triad nucleotide-binding protein [Candidatus Yanofskybacteria bacterium RIFCSPLOWO2_02_FULL_41_13]